MGTRALRKLREQEWEKQLAASRDETSEEEEEDEPVIISRPKNAFDMLNDANEDEDEDEDDQKVEGDQSQPSTIEQSAPVNSTPSAKSKKKKKKSKKKTKSQADTPQLQDSKEVSEDEIDKALKELSLKHPNDESTAAQDDTIWEKEASKNLSIEPKNLDPVNEMRGLFGNIALEDQSRTRTQPTRRRDQNLQGGVDLQTALSGRYNRASQGKELGALAKRRNCFSQGKEEWPLATSGGLSMEALPVTTFSKHYNFVHNQQYKAANNEFRRAVESMQAEAMIGLLQTYPYHVSCLLQVSEIAKHQGDSSLSGDLLERALFTLGRSVHSSFPAAMREGISRLDFNKPANRELYLTVWRYIRNLEQRGTWKTAFEWSKVLLQLDTTSDPFGVTLMIDQMALRGRQHEQFLSLVSDSAYGPAWSHLPNICISKTLALLRASKPREARQQLALAMHRYPYILSALASAIEVSPMPKSIWGKIPSTDAEKLYTELYVSRAKDLWNTPETIGLISEVANTMQYYKSFVDAFPPAPALQMSLEEARHVMALEVPALIALLPRKFTNMPTSSTDVLPPPGGEASDLTQRAPNAGPGAANGGPRLVAAGGDLISRALGWFFSPANRGDQAGGAAGSRADNLRALRQELGPEAAEIPDEALEQLMEIRLAQEFGELDDDELQQALGGGRMAGGFNYYDDEAPNNDEGNDEESMPDLESIPGEVEGEALQPRGPHAATVEEDEDEDEQAAPHRTGPTVGPLLRHVDDEEDEQLRRATQASNERAGASVATQTTSRAPTAIPTPAPVGTDEDIDGDPQRLQRWLIGAGVAEVKSKPNMSLYIRRLKLLHKNQQTWTLNMLKQRGEGDLISRIEQAL